MRFSLVQLPYFDPEQDLVLPLGILSLGSYANIRGHRPIIIDLNYPLKQGALKYNKYFFANSARYIINKGPDFIGFSVVCSTLPAALLIAKKCKELNPRSFIVFGGAGVFHQDILLMNHFDQIDAIIAGEGEKTLTQLLDIKEAGGYPAKISGLTFRSAGRIIRNAPQSFIKNLDDLPLIDFNLLPHYHKYKQGAMEGGRGCPFGCIFCTTSKMWGQLFRIKSPARLANELKRVARIFRANETVPVKIIHDNFLVNKNIINDFLAKLKPGNAFWDCSTRLDLLDKELLSNLSQAGCKSLFIGIESGSPRIQKRIRKKLSLTHLSHILKEASQIPLQIKLSFIVGFPGETSDDINKTLLLALRSKLYEAVSMIQLRSLNPLKGSTLSNEHNLTMRKSMFLPTDFSPLTTPLHAEISYIHNYPEIFSSFYPSGYTTLSPEYLEKIKYVFIFLANSFPLTTLLLYKRDKKMPLGLIAEIITFCERKDINWLGIFNAKFLSLSFLPFFNDYLQSQRLNALTREAALHEELLLNIRPVNIHNKLQRNSISLSSFPEINQNITIKCYQYNLIKISNKVRNYICDFTREKRPVVLAYLPGEFLRVIPLSPSLIKLLSLCDGRTSIRTITARFAGQISSSKSLLKIIGNKLRWLSDQGIITLPSPQ